MATTLRLLRLYQFYVGGTAGRANIELHDVQFAAAVRVQDAYPALRAAWFGEPGSLHLDGYMPITWADGFDVSLQPGADPSGLTLFFVNMGGYRKDSLAELHAFGLFVARDAAGAKAKARRSLLQGADQLHKDDLRDVDNCLALRAFEGLHVHLAANPAGRAVLPEWQGYRRIGRTAAQK